MDRNETRLVHDKYEIPSGFARAIAMTLLAVSLLATGSAPQSLRNLPLRYRDWLEKEVVFIIAAEEREAFLRLGNDADRDKFIEQFWLARDPTPGTPQNECRDEHYKRIEYANSHFSAEWNSDGWRSDRGKIWIILGPPQTRAFHTSGGQIYPMELWFYSKNEPSLPPFFYILFYQKDGMSDYRLYSPYLDGPDKLVRAAGVENQRANGYKFLRDYNAELARASLTLIPSEPASINDAPSLASDALLMKVVNLKEDKFHKEKILNNKRLQEEVTARVLRDASALQVAVLPMRDANGDDWLHYSLQIAEPSNYTLTRYKDQYYLSLEVRARVLDSKKNLIYETTREAVSYYAEKDLDDVRARPFSFDDKLPVLPGSYVLEFSLLNRVTRSYYKATASVDVEAQPAAALAVGKPLVIQKCTSAQSPEEPFNVSGARCVVQAKQEVPAGVTANVSILFPVYLPQNRILGDASAQPLKVVYTMGRLDRGVQPVVLEDELDARRANRFGALLVGKSLPVKELPEGEYILSVQVTDPVTKRTAGATTPMRLGGDLTLLPNIMTADNPARDERDGNNDYWRGLCAAAAKQQQLASTLFARAVALNALHAAARSQLAAAYFEKGDFAKTAALLEAGGVGKIRDGETLWRLVASLDKTGNSARALKLAEEALDSVEPSVSLFQELADLYERNGAADKARAFREKGRDLAGKRASQ